MHTMLAHLASQTYYNYYTCMQGAYIILYYTLYNQQGCPGLSNRMTIQVVIATEQNYTILGQCSKSPLGKTAMTYTPAVMSRHVLR